MRASEGVEGGEVGEGRKGSEGVMTLVGLMRRSGGWPHSSSGDCGDLELQETDNFSSNLTPPQPTSGRPVLWLERGHNRNVTETRRVLSVILIIEIIFLLNLLLSEQFSSAYI